MIKHLPSDWECPIDQADRGATERPHLSLAWYLDPVTGKAAARWVHEAPDAIANQELATAA